MGVEAVCASSLPEFRQALQAARKASGTTVIVVETDRETRVPGYESWWDVAVAEVSASESVRQARADYEEVRRRERYFL